MTYIENPKTKGSGILCAIPQRGKCPVGCKDCFFQSGRSFLEPLDENLPNVPSVVQARGYVVRMNDGNDSNNERDLVIETASQYEHVFYNTSMAERLSEFDAPVVLTINPGEMTDRDFHRVDPAPDNLMFVRFRVNTWNLELCDAAVIHYTKLGIPVILTFMAYYTEDIPSAYAHCYSFRKRTTNSYHVIDHKSWNQAVERYSLFPLVHTCGKDADTHTCKFCGNCLREYFATLCKKV